MSVADILSQIGRSSARTIGMDTLSSSSSVPDLLTVEEAARVLRIGRTKAHALTQAWRDSGGETGIPVIEIGGFVSRKPVSRNSSAHQSWSSHQRQLKRLSRTG